MGASIARVARVFTRRKRAKQAVEPEQLQQTTTGRVQTLTTNRTTSSVPPSSMKQGTLQHSGFPTYSHIQWDSKYYAAQAANFSPVAENTAANTTENDPTKSQSQLQFHFYANLFLSLLEHGKNIQDSLNDRLDEAAAKSILTERFNHEQFSAACLEGTCYVTKKQAISFLPNEARQQQAGASKYILESNSTV